MLDDLLPHYNAELRAVRELARDFAAAHPRIAGRLRLSADSVEDPHVGRLIEAFAFLNARTRLKLDDDFPELTEALLGQLYPHYLAPVPSMSVVALTPQPALAGLAVTAARSAVTTEAVEGEPLHFTTAYPVEMWPVALTAAKLSGPPLAAPRNPAAANAAGVLRLTFRCLNPGQRFTDLGLDRLRLFLPGEARTAQILHELLAGAVVSVALADSAVDESPVFLPASSVRPVGLAEAEVLLPLPPAAEPAYALLSELFCFPEKFLFFDLTGLSAKTLRDGGRTLEVFLYLDRHDPVLERQIGPSDFRLFCTPVVNLFPMRADPIRLDNGRFEHRISPDARRESALEVYSVEDVVVTDRSGEPQAYRPFFSVGRRREGREPAQRFWQASRRASPHAGGGDDVFLRVTDADGAVLADRDHIASVDIVATNRDLPQRLPFGGGRPKLALSPAGQAASVECLLAPTAPRRLHRGPGELWRLISHLTLNHVSVGEAGQGLAVVRELLALYDRPGDPAGRALADRLTVVEARPAFARAPGGGGVAFTSGVDLALEFDDARLSGSGAFLLGSVLEAVFASMAAVNAFSRTELRLKGEKGAWRRWPARTGTRELI